MKIDILYVFCIILLNLMPSLARSHLAPITASSLEGISHSNEKVAHKDKEIHIEEMEKKRLSTLALKLFVPFSKPQRSTSSSIMSRKVKQSKEERALAIDQEDYAQPKTHPPTKPPRK